VTARDFFSKDRRKGRKDGGTRGDDGFDGMSGCHGARHEAPPKRMECGEFGGRIGRGWGEGKRSIATLGRRSRSEAKGPVMSGLRVQRVREF